jgi:hypothetical protein
VVLLALAVGGVVVLGARWIGTAPLLVLAALLVAGVVAWVVLVIEGPVSRQRLERFARRQRLPITADNGNQVIRYLATTRRWRVAGFIAGLFASQIVAPPGTFVHANFLAIFTGWFLGALVAEVRVAHLEYGSIRAASLQPRRPDLYVRRFAWVLVPATAVVALATGAATAVAGATGWARPDWPRAVALLVAALGLAATIRAIQHAVLRRAQPLAAPDVIRADDAIRSRSLHVLCGGGGALVLFVVINQLAAIRPVGLVAGQLDDVVFFFGVLAAAALGWLVATSIWPPPGTTTRGADTPAVGAA